MQKDNNILPKVIDDFTNARKELSKLDDLYLKKRDEFEKVIYDEKEYNKNKISSLNEERVENERRIKSLYDDKYEMDSSLFQIAIKNAEEAETEDDKMKWFENAKQVAEEKKNKEEVEIKELKNEDERLKLQSEYYENRRTDAYKNLKYVKKETSKTTW